MQLLEEIIYIYMYFNIGKQLHKCNLEVKNGLTITDVHKFFSRAKDFLPIVARTIINAQKQYSKAIT